MNSKQGLFKRKPNPWKMLVWELREALPYLAFYIIIAVAFVIVFGVCIYCQNSVAFGHEWGLI
jgi:hypothetical protein